MRQFYKVKWRPNKYKVRGFHHLTSLPHHPHRPWHHQWHRSSSPPSCPWSHSASQTPSWSSESEAASAVQMQERHGHRSTDGFVFVLLLSSDSLTDLFVHGGHGFGDPLHSLCHAVVGFECLYLQTDSLDVSFHHDELFDVAPSANQILGHDLDGVLQRLKNKTIQNKTHTSCFFKFLKLTKQQQRSCLSYHLSLFGHFLNVGNDFLLLLLQFWSLPVQVSHGPIECPLILLQHLLWSLSASKQELHLFWKQIMQKSQT